MVVAEAQTAGRGRMGRVWFSPPGAGTVRLGHPEAVRRPVPTRSESGWRC